MSETFHESKRESPPPSTSNEVSLEDGDGNALLKALRAKGVGSGDMGGLSLDDLKELFRRCFTTGISK